MKTMIEILLVNWQFLLALALGLTWLAVSLYKATQFDRPKDKPVVAKSALDGPFSYPGYMAYKDHHGCRVARFKSYKDMNKFFSPGGGGDLRSVVEIIPQYDGSILTVYTIQVTDEMIDDIHAWSYEKHQWFEEKMKKDKEEKIAAEKERLRKEAEDKDFADKWRKYQERTKHMRSLAPGSLEREKLEAKLNRGELDE